MRIDSRFQAFPRIRNFPVSTWMSFLPYSEINPKIQVIFEVKNLPADSRLFPINGRNVFQRPSGQFSLEKTKKRQ